MFVGWVEFADELLDATDRARSVLLGTCGIHVAQQKTPVGATGVIEHRIGARLNRGQVFLTPGTAGAGGASSTAGAGAAGATCEAGATLIDLAGD